MFELLISLFSSPRVKQITGWVGMSQNKLLIDDPINIECKVGRKR